LATSVGIITVWLDRPSNRNDIAMRYFTLGVSQLRRFERSGEHPDLDNAITSQLKAVEYSDAETPNLAVYLSHLSDCQMRRFDCLDSLADLVAAVSNEQKAVDLTSGRNLIGHFVFRTLVPARCYGTSDIAGCPISKWHCPITKMQSN
jgi:hypothetical protein